MESKKPACFYCHITFGLAEERVWVESQPFHEHCNKKRERKARIREFLLRHAVDNGLKVVPHHPNGR